MTKLTVSEFKKMVDSGEWTRDQMIFMGGITRNTGSNPIKIGGLISIHSKLKGEDVSVGYMSSFSVEVHSEIADITPSETIITIHGDEIDSDSDLYQCLTDEFKNIDLDFLKLDQRAKLIDEGRMANSMASIG